MALPRAMHVQRRFRRIQGTPATGTQRSMRRRVSALDQRGLCPTYDPPVDPIDKPDPPRVPRRLITVGAGGLGEKDEDVRKVVERSGLNPCRLPPPLPQRHRVRPSPRSRRVPAGIEDGWGFPVQEGSGTSDRGPRYRSTVQVPRLLSPPKPCTTKQYLHAGHGPVESSLATRSGCGSFFGRVGAYFIVARLPCDRGY